MNFYDTDPDNTSFENTFSTSEVYFSYPAGVYPSTTFGYPHRIPSPQPNEPFFWQYPAWAQPGLKAHYYFTHTSETMSSQQHYMDSDNVVIGSKSRFGKKPEGGKTAAEKRAASEKRAQKKKAEVMVDIYNGPDFIQRVPLRLLTRFSKLASAEFPRPKAGKEKAGNGEGKDSGEAKVKDVEAELSKLQLANKDINAEAPAPKVLELSLAGVTEYPENKAVKTCLEWMDVNRRHSPSLIPFFLQNAHVPLHPLIDVYAAVLSFDLRPFPRQLRQDIMNRLTMNKPTAADVTYIYARIPMDDGVVTRMITSYFQHRARREYSDEEADEIRDVVSNSEGLWARFEEIEDARWEKKQERIAAAKQANGHARMQRAYQELAGEDGGAANGGKNQGRRNGGGKKQTTGTVAPQAKAEATTVGASAEEVKGDKKAKPEKQGNVMGVGGRHVPGA